MVVSLAVGDLLAVHPKRRRLPEGRRRLDGSLDPAKLVPHLFGDHVQPNVPSLSDRARCTLRHVHVVLGSDDAGPLVEAISGHLIAAGHDVRRVEEGSEWPEVGRAVAEAVASGDADFGVVCCWTGTGVTIAANKVPGVRAALCRDAETAEGARRWNDANVLALSLRATTPAVAAEILDAWLDSSPDRDELEAIARVEL
jgi:ribose 5-phosphate isomerase B